MYQRTIRQIRDQIKLLQDAQQLPFRDLLDDQLVQDMEQAPSVHLK